MFNVHTSTPFFHHFPFVNQNRPYFLKIFKNQKSPISPLFSPMYFSKTTQKHQKSPFLTKLIPEILKSTQKTVYFVLSTWYFHVSTMYFNISTMYFWFSTLYFVFSIQYFVFSTLYFVHSTQYFLFSSLLFCFSSLSLTINPFTIPG